MGGIADSSSSTRFALIEDRAKGLKLIGIMVLGRTLRDIIVPAGSQVGRGVYVGALVSVILYILRRPEIAPGRAVLWAVLGGLAATAVMAL